MTSPFSVFFFVTVKNGGVYSCYAFFMLFLLFLYFFMITLVKIHLIIRDDEIYLSAQLKILVKIIFCLSEKKAKPERTRKPLDENYHNCGPSQSLADTNGLVRSV